MDLFRIPGKTVERHTDTVFRKEIGHVLKEHIEMTGEETGLGTGGLTQQVIDAPDADRIIAVKGEGGSVRGNTGASEITGGITKPAAGIAEKTVKALDHTDRKGETQLINKRTIHPVSAEGEDTVFIKDDTEAAVHGALILQEGTEFVLKDRFAAVTGNHSAYTSRIITLYFIISKYMIQVNKFPLHVVVKFVNFL